MGYNVLSRSSIPDYDELADMAYQFCVAQQDIAPSMVTRIMNPSQRGRDQVADFVSHDFNSPTTLAIGRRVLGGTARNLFTSLIRHTALIADTLDMRVLRSPATLAVPYTAPLAPDTAQALFATVMASTTCGYTRYVAEHPISITGTADVTRSGDTVSIGFILDDFAEQRFYDEGFTDSGAELHGERSLVQSYLQPGTDTDPYTEPLHIEMLQASGGSALQLLDASYALWDKCVDVEVELSRLGIASYFKAIDV